MITVLGPSNQMVMFSGVGDLQFLAVLDVRRLFFHIISKILVKLEKLLILKEILTL